MVAITPCNYNFNLMALISFNPLRIKITDSFNPKKPVNIYLIIFSFKKDGIEDLWPYLYMSIKNNKQEKFEIKISEIAINNNDPLYSYNSFNKKSMKIEFKRSMMRGFL